SAFCILTSALLRTLALSAGQDGGEAIERAQRCLNLIFQWQPMIVLETLRDRIIPTGAGIFPKGAGRFQSIGQADGSSSQAHDFSPWEGGDEGAGGGGASGTATAV